MQARNAIAARRSELETLRADYERQALRYQRDQAEAPLRVRRLLDRYNDGVGDYDSLTARFDADVDVYSAACGHGSAAWENYAAACRPYLHAGNPYCEAFADLWARLQVGR